MPRLAIIDQVVSAGGVERFLHGLVGGMLDLSEIKGWDITILLNRYNSGGRLVKWPEHLIAPNLRVAYLGDDRWSRLLDRLARPRLILGIPGTGWAQAAIPRMLRRYGTPRMRMHAGDDRLRIEHCCSQQRFDVVYFSYPYLMDCPRMDVPLIATAHDFNYKRFSTFGPAIRDQIERQTPEWFHRCRRIVVSSEFMASELRHFYPEHAGKVRVIRLGIPASATSPASIDVEAYGRRLDLPKRFLLTAGWIVPHKNQKVLFEALGRLRGKGIDMPLVCVGPNSGQLQADKKEEAAGYVVELLRTAENASLCSGRDFRGLGYVDDFELECLYRLAAGLVLPSLYEAGSFPLIEAARAHCPIACSRIPAHVEQANLLGNNIWLFEPSDPADLADVIEAMLSQRETAAQRATRAAELVGQSYSWQKAAEGYLSVFREAMQTDVQTGGGRT